MRLNLLPFGALMALSPLLAISVPLTATAQMLYVSPAGNDQNPGTESSPFRTLERARDWARSLNQNQTNDLTIFLEGGTYRLSAPIVLDAHDSGTGGHNIIYAAAPGQSPILSGGAQVTGWKLVDASKNLWSAPAPAGFVNTRQLYVNGVRAERTRGRLPVKLTETKTGYVADSPAMADWRNPGDIEFVYTGGNGLWSEHSEGLGAWTEPRCPVASIEGTTITMAQPCWDNSTKRVLLPLASGFRRTANLVGPASIGREPEYVENAYELLGTPGQWYFDRTTRKFYYVPRPGENLETADVEAPALEKLISGEGTDSAPVHNIIFKGIQFSYATWLLPGSKEGFSEIQANYMVTGPDGYAAQGLCDFAPGGKCPFGDWTKTPGNISFNYDRQIQFLRDDFVHLGAAGLELGDGSQSDTVEGCVLTDVSANGIELGGVDLPEGQPAQVTRDNRILNNHIYNIAAEYHGGIGIDVGYAQNTLIAHNQLDHLPYTAISMGWGGWPDKIHRAGVANNSRNNIVADNLIYDHMQLLADGGAIYTQGLTGPSLAEGEKIIGNVIYDQLGSGHGIYTDNGCNNVTAKSNVIFNVNFDDWGGRHRDYYDGHDGKVYDAFDCEDNYWQQGDRDVSTENVTLKNNHLIKALEQAPESIRHQAGLQAAFKEILNQHFSNSSAPEPPSRVAAFAGNGFALVAWNPSIADGGSPVKSYTVISSGGERTPTSEEEYRANGYVKMIGLQNGRDYTFSVEAVNANGASSPSLPSAMVNPQNKTIQTPSAPTVVSVEPGDGMVSIHFRAPDHDGGSPITSYVITVEPGGRQMTMSGRSVLTLGGRHTTFAVVAGLENGRQYTFNVAAVNSAGEGKSISTHPITLATAPTESPATFTLETQHPGRTIPEDFEGLSYETKQMLPGTDGRHYFSPRNTPLIQMFRTLGIRCLRIGGNTADRPGVEIPDDHDIDRLFEFAKAANVRVIYTVRLRNGDPQADAQIVHYILEHYPHQILCFTIGNEPDFYETNYPTYHGDWTRFMQTIVALSPTARFCGPSTGGHPVWASDFAADLAHNQRIAFVTQHYYPGGGGNKVTDSAAGRDELLSPEMLAKYAPFYKKFAPAAITNGLDYRLEEANNFYNGGAKGVSDTFAAALWGLDFLHWWAEHDANGINFHTGDKVAAGADSTVCKYATFVSAPDGYAARPLAYGLKAFDLGSHGEVIPVTLSGGANLTAYAVLGADHAFYLTLINKEHDSEAKSSTAEIRLDQGNIRRGQIMYLTAPHHDIAATTGESLGGKEISLDGNWNGKWQRLDPQGDNTILTVQVPAASAAIVKLIPASK